MAATTERPDTTSTAKGDAMTQSTAPERIKPEKPALDFPLFPHATGRWAKKIAGKMHYFGPWSDPEGALQRYRDQADDLHPRPKPARRVVRLNALCAEFLRHKQHQLEASEIGPRTLRAYRETCSLLTRTFGARAIIEDLVPADFRDLRAKLASRLGPDALGVAIQRVRSVFKFAADEHLVSVRYGKAFDKPAPEIARRERQARGKRMFEPHELRQIIENARQPLKAMILLGVNAGLGQSDCSSLPQTVVDLDAGWLDYARHKTAVERRAPLWPETVAAIREAITMRPKPADPADANLCFLRASGKRWVIVKPDGRHQDSVCKQFTRLLDKLNLNHPGLGFYTLRRTVETIGERSRDLPAVMRVMGHTDGSMSGRYRVEIDDERLRAVTDAIYEWLFGAGN